MQYPGKRGQKALWTKLKTKVQIMVISQCVHKVYAAYLMPWLPRQERMIFDLSVFFQTNDGALQIFPFDLRAIDRQIETHCIEFYFHLCILVFSDINF